jgi:hypothetical protein
VIEGKQALNIQQLVSTTSTGTNLRSHSITGSIITTGAYWPITLPVEGSKGEQGEQIPLDRPRETVFFRK